MTGKSTERTQRTGRAVGLAGLAVLLCLPVLSPAQTVMQDLSASVAALGKVSVPASLTLNTSGTTFLSFGGAFAVSYRARTSSGGTGNITLQATSDFTPAGGPTVASSTLTYTCSGATLGSACSGTQTVSTASQTPVLNISGASCTGGGGSCSSVDPNTISISFGLTNSPSYQTGSYTAQITFTISAT